MTTHITVHCNDGTAREVLRSALPLRVAENAAARQLRALAECRHGDACPRGRAGCIFVHFALLKSDPVPVPAPAAAPAPAPAEDLITVLSAAVAPVPTPPPSIDSSKPASVSGADAEEAEAEADADAGVMVRVRRSGAEEPTVHPLSTLVENSAKAYLRTHPSAVSRECRGHHPRSTVTAETCNYVHFKTPAAAAAPATMAAPAAAAAVVAAAPAVAAPRVPVPPASPLCCVCGDEVVGAGIVHTTCKRAHRACAECVCGWLQHGDLVVPIGETPHVRCLMHGCDDATPLSLLELARLTLAAGGAAAAAAFEAFVAKQHGARTALAVAEATEQLRVAGSQAQRRIDMMVLARSLPRSMAYACRKCGFGPILLDGCNDVMSHHGEEVSSGNGGRINNACSNCGNHATTIEEMCVRWDGVVRDTDELRRELLDRLARGGRGGGRGGDRGGGRGFGRGFGRGYGRGGMAEGGRGGYGRGGNFAGRGRGAAPAAQAE